MVCVAGHDVVGVATFHLTDRQCELVTLDALREGQGVGSALLAAVIEKANRQQCQRFWLMTTNDNLRALRFYQRRGMRLVAVHRGAVDDARLINPSIPVVGDHGIAIHDELELELQSAPPQRSISHCTTATSSTPKPDAETLMSPSCQSPEALYTGSYPSPSTRAMPLARPSRRT
jgi:hypothetical protein